MDMYRIVDALHAVEGAQTRKDDTYISDRLMMLEGSYHSKYMRARDKRFSSKRKFSSHWFSDPGTVHWSYE